MALGKRRREWQLEAFVVASDLPKSPGHSFSMATASTAHSKAPCSIGRAPSRTYPELLPQGIGAAGFVGDRLAQELAPCDFDRLLPSLPPGTLANR